MKLKEKESYEQKYVDVRKTEEIARLKNHLTTVKEELERRTLHLAASEKDLQKVNLELAEKSTEVRMLQKEREEMKVQLDEKRKQINEYLMQQPLATLPHITDKSKVKVSTDDVGQEKWLPLTPSRKKQCEELFSVLGLIDFYPQKLTLHHALEIREDTLENVQHLMDKVRRSLQDRDALRRSTHCTNPRMYPFLILQKIMAFDYTCRMKLVLSSKTHSDSIQILSTKSVGENATDHVVHPMDGLLAVLHCAENFLRQDLMSRLATCPLAIPLLLPDPIEPHKVTLPIWAMQSIVKQWHTSNGTSKEGHLVSYPSPLVSFLRIGKFKVSKSHIMNYVISESEHNTFFQYNCVGGSAKHLLVNGLVEVCWYLPSKRDMIFSDLVSFTNLHGDAPEHPKQVKFLSKVSFMNFVFISGSEDSLNDKALKVLESLAAAPGGLVLLQVEPSENDDAWLEWLEPIKQLVQVISLEDKNEADIRDEIREQINCKINEKWNDAMSHFSLGKHCDAARFCDIFVDEDEQDCQKGKELAEAFEKILNNFKKTHGAESLKRSHPLSSRCRDGSVQARHGIQRLHKYPYPSISFCFKLLFSVTQWHSPQNDNMFQKKLEKKI